MNKTSIWFVEFINKIFPRPKFMAEVHDAKLATSKYQEWEYQEAVRITPEFGELWRIKGKKLLDVGCGLGGKPVFYAEQDPEKVVAIDIRFASTLATKELATSRGHSNIYTLNVDAGNLPFPSNCFDVIVSINVFEHVDQLYRTLEECKRVLVPGGLLFLHFPPFYSPWGAHLEGWINFPWPHLLFSDKVLLAAAARIDEKLKNNSEYIQQARFSWACYEQLPELNRITIKGFRKLINALNIRILKSEMLPVGRHYLLTKGILGKVLLNIVRYLTKIPLLQEMITTKMIFILMKEPLE